MKRVTKKIWSAILTILMLMNYIPIVVTAAEIVNSEERGNVSISLESTASKYLAEEYIYVDLRINSITKANKIAQFSGFIEYSEQNLQLEEITISEELASKGYSANRSSAATKKIFIENTSGNATLDSGDIICTIKFKALKSSDYETEIKVYSIDASDSEDQQISSESFEFYEETDIYINEPTITLPVERATLAHNLKITKTDESENAITKNSALFKITKLDGEVVYQETDENGDITIPSLEMPTTEAPYIYTIEEILAPTGYVKNEAPIQVTVTFDDEGNVLTALSGENGIASVTNGSNTIEVKVLNKEKEAEVEKEVFNLVINKVDEENDSITTDTAEFTLTMPDGTKTNYSTNSSGKTENIAVLAPEKAGTYTYLIKETKAPSGYIAEESNIILELTYEKQENKIVLASGRIVSYNNEAIIISSGDVRTATVNIKNEKQVFTYNYSININKVKNDTFKTNITEDTAMFEITKDSETKYIKTNQLGKATYEFEMTNKEIVVGKEYTYTIKEIKAPNGYILDETAKTITLTFNEDGSINTSELNGSNIEKINSGTNVVNIKIINEKEPEVVPPVPEDFKLAINKVDEEGNTITSDSTEYIVTTPDGTQINYTTAGNNENILAPEKAGTYIYVLTETKTPEGYKKGNDIVLKLTFEEVDGKIILVSGDNGVEVTQEEAVKVATLNVETEKEEPEIVVPEGQDFDLVISKVDENNNLIIADTASFVLTNPDGTRNTLSTVNGITQKITLKAPNVVGKQIYFVQETKAPNGYNILNESLVIEANFIENEGKIVLSSATVREYNKEIIPLNNTLTVSIINTKHEEEIEPETYNIKISGVDKEGNAIETGTTVIKLTNKDTGNYEYKEVQIKDGIIELEMPRIEGISNYELEQIKAPDGYEVNSNPAQVTITFGKDENEKIEVSNYIVTGENINKGTNDNKNTVSLVITNEKIKEEPQKQNYSIEINKLDSVTKNLITEGSAIFTIVDSNGNIKEYATTNGKITISDVIPGNVGESYIFVIKEKVAPEGYKLTSESIIMKVSFEEVEEKIVVTNPELILGNKIATVSKTENGNIKIDITNEKEQDDEELYVISKKDTAGINIYNLFTSYTGRQYTINEPFIDTKEAKYGGNVTAQEFINNLESNGVLTILDEEGNLIPNGNRVKTGMILKATKGKQEKTFKIVVKGDSNKDGRVTTVDINMLEKHLTGEKTVTDPIILRSLDLGNDTGDGRITTVDVNKFYTVQTK